MNERAPPHRFTQSTTRHDSMRFLRNFEMTVRVLFIELRTTLIMPAEPPPSRIRAYVPRDEKQVRFIVGQAQMEALAYANNNSEGRRLIPFGVNSDDLFFSVLSSVHPRRMDLRFVHLRSVHELVAKFRTRDLGLVTDPACVLRPGGAHHVPR